MIIKKPNLDYTPKFLHYFIDLVDSKDLLLALNRNKIDVVDLLKSIPKELEDYEYAERKWSTKKVFQHIVDCERIYQYRAFRFSRFDGTALVGFDENATLSKLDSKSLDIKKIELEFLAVREATIALFSSMHQQQLDFEGSASGIDFTARQLGYMAVGHSAHHLNFIREKYLI